MKGGRGLAAVGQRVALKEAAVLWRQLALLIGVGVPLLRALRQVAERTSNRLLRQAVGQVADTIETGSSFSEALAQHPRVFSRLTVQLVQVAERGGVLDDALQLVAEELERQVEVRSKVRRALAYPAVVALVGALVALFVLVVVIPQFTALLQEQQVPLPLPTRLVVGTGHFLAAYWWLCLLGVAALVAGWRLALRTPRGRLLWDRCKLRLPLVGNLLVKAGVLRFAQTLGTLLRGGVPILVSLRLVQEHAENQALAQALARAYRAVDQGSRLEEPLRQSALFPPLAVDVIAVGEEAGRLDTVLFKLAEMYRGEVDQAAAIFSSIIEPLLLLLMGIFVALIVWAVYLPYFLLPGGF
ncbi:MAG: type II secretion system protein F [Candidatus Tectimicrobiota bacterium]|nr:MAG: type II secretion system protein F [Candidatus Tectomicrobia bacterium]